MKRSEGVKFYLFPSEQVHSVSTETETVFFHYLTAFATAGLAEKHRKLVNAGIDSINTLNTWRVKLPKAVGFTNLKQQSSPLILTTAPEACWAILDYTNGEPTTPDGKRYLFIFKSKPLADTYMRIMRQNNLGFTFGGPECDRSMPFRLYQSL